MRRINLYALCMLTLLAAACKKKNNSAGTSCKIIGQSIADSSASSVEHDNVTIEYSGDKVSIVFGAPGYNNEVTTIIKSGNSVFKSELIGSSPLYDTMVLNSAGLVTLQRESDGTGRSEIISTMTYDDAGQLTGIKRWNTTGKAPMDSVVVYTWSEGDCISENHIATGQNITYTYYDNLAAADFNAASLRINGYLLLSNKHLVKSESYTGRYEFFTYQMDGNKVTSMQTAFSTSAADIPTGWDTETYTYDCN